MPRLCNSLFIVNRIFCQVVLLAIIWRPSTYFNHFINKLAPHLCLPGLAALQIPFLIDTQLVVWLGAVPITHIFQAWQADRPPPSNTIIPSKHQTNTQLWCGSWACSLKRGISGTPFAPFLMPEIAAVSQQPSNWVLSVAQGGFCSSSADRVVLENNQEQQPGVGRDLGCENNNNQGWGMGDRAVVGPSEALVRGH